MAKNQGKRERSFQEFKTYFYGAFDDPSIFDCQEFNLLKVVQDGLKIEYSFRSWWGKPLWIYSLLGLFQRWKAILLGKENPFSVNGLDQLGGRPYLLLDAGRYIDTETGQRSSVYLHRLLEAIPAHRRVFALEREGVQGEVDYDLSVEHYADFIDLLPLQSDEKELYRQLRLKLAELKTATRFTEEEINHVRLSMHKFWNQYRLWRYFLQYIQPNWALLVCHYHKEGLMLALKRKGIKTIELQHGLIAPEDIFYIYPKSIAPIASKALFADEIWTYGEHWRNILLQGAEYKADQILVRGYYLYEKAERDQQLIQQIRDKAAGAPILLITTQTLLFQTFIDYVQWLSEDLIKKNIQGFILVKPHPSNALGTFNILEKLPNVMVSRKDLYDLFSASDMHLSIYSTTLYEATRQGLINFALYDEACKDYVDTILATKIAIRLDWGVNPFELSASATETDTGQTDAYFAPFEWRELGSHSLDPTSISS